MRKRLRNTTENEIQFVERLLLTNKILIKMKKTIFSLFLAYKYASTKTKHKVKVISFLLMLFCIIWFTQSPNSINTQPVYESQMLADFKWREIQAAVNRQVLPDSIVSECEVIKNFSCYDTQERLAQYYGTSVETLKKVLKRKRVEIDFQYRYTLEDLKNIVKALGIGSALKRYALCQKIYEKYNGVFSMRELTCCGRSISDMINAVVDSTNSMGKHKTFFSNDINAINELLEMKINEQNTGLK
jgi:hypothetical protein